MRLSLGWTCLLLLGTVLVVAAALPHNSESSLEADAIAADIIQEEAGTCLEHIIISLLCMHKYKA